LITEIFRLPVLHRDGWPAAAVAVAAGLDAVAVAVELLPVAGAELVAGAVAGDVTVLGGDIDVAAPQPATAPTNVSPAIRTTT
jgi:hypothetical protein